MCVCVPTAHSVASSRRLFHLVCGCCCSAIVRFDFLLERLKELSYFWAVCCSPAAIRLCGRMRPLVRLPIAAVIIITHNLVKYYSYYKLCVECEHDRKRPSTFARTEPKSGKADEPNTNIGIQIICGKSRNEPEQAPGPSTERDCVRHAKLTNSMRIRLA